MKIKVRKKNHESRGDRIMVIICYLMIFAVVVVTFLPFWELFVVSISNRADAVRGGIKLFTSDPELTAYKQVLSSKNIWISAWNSIIRVVLVRCCR